MKSLPGDQATGKNRRRVLATAFVLATAIASIPSMASAAADGALDTTFGTGGKVTTAVGVADQSKAIAIQSNGKILVVGDNMADFEVVRYNTDGSLDTSFDTDGKVTADIGTSTTDTANAVTIQSDGKIIVAGSSGGMAPNSGNFAVVRYNTDGSLDTSFDTDGKVTTDIGTSTTDTGSSAVIQSDGKIVVVGDNYSDFVIVRYTTTGALDTTFDTDGKVTTDIGTSTSDAGTAVAIQGDSKIVVAGRSGAGGPPSFAVARYEVTATSPSSSSSSSSTSTTVAATTTTVAATTTTVAAAVTTTTVAATTTVVAAATTTTNAVVKRTATAAANKPSTTLPATGSNSSMPGIIGATLVAVGLVLATRRRLMN